MREIGKGGFEGIKSLIEQNLYLEYGYIQDYIPEEYDLKYQNLNDNGKIIILNNIIGELGYHHQIIGTRDDFEDFDWQKSLSTELLDIYNNSADDIEQKISDWSAHILINEIHPFCYSLANNDLMIDCYSLFRNLINDLEIDPVSKNKVVTDIIKKLQESIAYNSNFLDTNSATKDDMYLLTEKINLLYQQVLTMIKKEFSQYFNASDFVVSTVSTLTHTNYSLQKTVFGLNFEFIRLLYENLKVETFIEESCTEEIFLHHFFVDIVPETQIILHGRNQSDIGLLIDSLLRFFKKEYQDKTFFNNFWAERFKFQTNRDSQNPKNKSPKDISKIISSVKTGDRISTKKNIIDKIVRNLEAVPR